MSPHPHGHCHRRCHPQVSTSFFTYRPVLKCLQDMTAVPMAQELLLGQAPQHVDYWPAGKVQEVGRAKGWRAGGDVMDVRHSLHPGRL